MSGSTRKRVVSRLARAGAEASREARKKLLLVTLEEQRWNLTVTAEVLEMNGASDVIRAIRDLGMHEDYERAMVAGLIVVGRHRKK